MEFSNDEYKLKKDRFLKSRGGTSKLLYISCSNCSEPVMIYQKDGPGRLLRCYSDRIIWPPELVEKQKELSINTIKNIGSLACNVCNNILAHPMIYKPENRLAYRIIPGSVHSQRNIE